MSKRPKYADDPPGTRRCPECENTDGEHKPGCSHRAPALGALGLAIAATVKKARK